MPVPKGIRIGGRQKGTPNKLTSDLKGAILGALQNVGGQAYLETVAKENPQVFCSLLGKVLPTTLTGDPEKPVAVEMTINDAHAFTSRIAGLAARNGADEALDDSH